jgi:OPA family glycerol-3-phosphate transporter-like MFS transporter 1/2
VSLAWNILLMAAAGLFVNGPYALITTAVSADLGNHSSLAGVSPSCPRARPILETSGSVMACVAA